MTAIPAVNRAGWLFRLQPPGQKPPAGGRRTGPYPQPVPSVEVAFALYQRTEGPGDIHTFRRRCEVVNAEGVPTGEPLSATPVSGTLFFCPLQFPDAPAGGEPVPVVLADGPYPRELRELAIEHRPLFHFDKNDPERPLDVAEVFRRAGYATAEQLFPDWDDTDSKGGGPKEAPSFVPIPDSSLAARVYVHVVIVRDGRFVRAFVQYYVFLRGKSPSPGAGAAKGGRTGDWQFAQIEFLKKVGEKKYVPFTVGCSGRGIGQARFFNAVAAGLNRQALIYPPGGLTRLLPDLADGKKRPKLYVARETHALHFKPGVWRPAVTGTDVDLCRAAGRAAAALPRLFPARAAALEPDCIHEPQPFDVQLAELVFLLDGAPPDAAAGANWPAYWLSWHGRYGDNPKAPRGLKYHAPVNLGGAASERTDLSWWANPHRFQARFLRVEYVPLEVTPVRLQVTAGGVQAIVGRVPAAEHDAAANPIYAPIGLSASGPGLAALWRGIGELLCLRVADRPEGQAPAVLRLLAPDRPSEQAPLESAITLTQADFDSAIKELSRHKFVALDVQLIALAPGGAGAAPPRNLVDLRETPDTSATLRLFTLPPMAALVPDMTLAQRHLEVFARTALFLPVAAHGELQRLCAPANLGTTMGAVALALGYGATPIGWGCDLLMVPFQSPRVLDVLDHLFAYLDWTAYATADTDLDRAAWHLAQLVTAVGAQHFVKWIVDFSPLRSLAGPAERAPDEAARMEPTEITDSLPAELPLEPPPGPPMTPDELAATTEWRAEPWLYSFRGDRVRSDAPIEKVMREGLKSKGTNDSLLEHTRNTRPESGYVASSRSPAIARGFAGKSGWVIVIRSQRGIDTVTALCEANWEPGQVEIAYPRKVPTEEIVGCYRLVNGELQEFIPNPNYRNPAILGAEPTSLATSPAPSPAPAGARSTSDNLSGGDWFDRNIRQPVYLKFDDHNYQQGLDPEWRDKVVRFVNALRKAGAIVDRITTYRSVSRQYLMYTSKKIVEGLSPREADQAEKYGADIRWDHGNDAVSRDKAWEMVRKFAITGSQKGRKHIGPVAKPDSSHHTRTRDGNPAALAIDMRVSWPKSLVFKDEKGNIVDEVTTEPRDGTNPELAKIAAKYGVIKWIVTKSGKQDPPHWSSQGN